METNLPTFKPGQRVWFIRTGKWHTLEPSKNESNFYPFYIETDDDTLSFTEDGRYYSGDSLPLIFHTEQKLDFSQPKFMPEKGQWCWFWYDQNLGAILGQFNGMVGNLYGLADDAYKNCAPFTGELPPHLENL